MISIIKSLRIRLSRIDSTSARIFFLGLIIFELCLCASAVLIILSFSAHDREYYTLVNLGQQLYGTGFRVLTFGTVLCFVSDIVFHMNI